MAEEEETVDRIMDPKVLTAPLDSTVKDCAKSMAQRAVSYAVVVEGEIALGIVTEHDLVTKILADGLDPSKVLVRDIMSTPLITTRPSAPVSEAAKLMTEYRVRRIVAIGDGGILAGIVTAADIARMMAKKQGFSDVNLNALARTSESPTGGPYQ